MRYVAIRYFEDKEDHNTAYDIGCIYPRKGLEVSEARIKQLSSYDNNQGQAVIVELKEIGQNQDTQEQDTDNQDNTQEQDTDNTQDISNMSLEQLRQIAKDQNISYSKNTKKTELIQLINKIKE